MFSYSIELCITEILKGEKGMKGSKGDIGLSGNCTGVFNHNNLISYKKF